jgi:hypothetical protein
VPIHTPANRHAITAARIAAEEAERRARSGAVDEARRGLNDALHADFGSRSLRIDAAQTTPEQRGALDGPREPVQASLTPEERNQIMNRNLRQRMGIEPSEED